MARAIRTDCLCIDYARAIPGDPLDEESLGQLRSQDHQRHANSHHSVSRGRLDTSVAPFVSCKSDPWREKSQLARPLSLSAGNNRAKHSSRRIEVQIEGSGRIVAYPDRAAFFGDYFRIAGDSPGTIDCSFQALNEHWRFGIK